MKLNHNFHYVELPEEAMGLITLALLNSGVPAECQQCHKGRMQIQPGISVTVLQDRYPYIRQDGRVIACALTTCSHCGHKEEYELKSLGLMEKLEPYFDRVIAEMSKEVKKDD